MSIRAKAWAIVAVAVLLSIATLAVAFIGKTTANEWAALITILVALNVIIFYAGTILRRTA